MVGMNMTAKKQLLIEISVIYQSYQPQKNFGRGITSVSRQQIWFDDEGQSLASSSWIVENKAG